MGVPYYNTDMTRHPQYITVRNDRGQEMLDTVRSLHSGCSLWISL